uniref:Putative nucleotide-diphospho-sugar transferase n=1 Tax=viral metagenome TaxID=1070528 RepID=A0A6M3KGG2_9ZZZZ
MTEFKISNIKIDNWIVVAFVTHDTVYELELAQHLLPSLEKIGLPHYIEVIDNKGSWLKNVAEKPAVAYRALEKYPSKNIILLDADSEILEYPKLFNEIPEEYDLACHFLEWESWYGYKGDKTKELLSGTMFLRNNDKIKELCKQWYDRANNNHEWEQKSLASVIVNSEVKIFSLPLSYCYIKTLPSGEEPIVKIDNPTIVHFQASRRYKKVIK